MDYLLSFVQEACIVTFSSNATRLEYSGEVISRRYQRIPATSPKSMKMGAFAHTRKGLARAAFEAGEARPWKRHITCACQFELPTTHTPDCFQPACSNFYGCLDSLLHCFAQPVLHRLTNARDVSRSLYLLLALIARPTKAPPGFSINFEPDRIRNVNLRP